MRYVEARIAQEFDDLTYRIYISDGMNCLLGAYKDRYINIINGYYSNDQPESGEEIVIRIFEQGGLTLGE